MIHIRIDNWEDNSKREFACGIKELPEGDKWFHVSESAADRHADCPVCNPNPRRLGTPISRLSGQPGQPGYEEFKRIAESWGFP